MFYLQSNIHSIYAFLCNQMYFKYTVYIMYAVAEIYQITGKDIGYSALVQN